MTNTTNMMHGCSCTAECGCIGAPVVPSCDNSVVPKVRFLFTKTHNHNHIPSFTQDSYLLHQMLSEKSVADLILYVC